jgi:uncharacterized protein
MLSGHTHGGQVVLGRLHTLVLCTASFFGPYIAGLYTVDATRLYVNRGIGTTIVPIRVNCPPEITVLRLVP